MDVYQVKATVEYDGAAYQGFQLQRQAPTIQGELEKALRSVTQEDIRLVGAGRTDTGVHALGQVVHFYTCWAHPLAALQRAWNATLPFDIAVRELEQAPEGFHARFSAVSRLYRYTIYTGEVRRPLFDRFSSHVPGPLDVEAMSEAARALIGQQDFAAFGRAPQGANTVRTVYRATFCQQGELLIFDIEANAFLRRMVRLIIGTLLVVGKGVLSPAALQEILVAGDMNHPMAPVSPSGLCLMRVNYEKSARIQ